MFLELNGTSSLKTKSLSFIFSSCQVFATQTSLLHGAWVLILLSSFAKAFREDMVCLEVDGHPWEVPGWSPGSLLGKSLSVSIPCSHRPPGSPSVLGRTFCLFEHPLMYIFLPGQPRKETPWSLNRANVLQRLRSSALSPRDLRALGFSYYKGGQLSAGVL